MTPGPDGSLFVSIPRKGGSVLALLDRDGQPRPGWPITVGGSIACRLLVPVADGTVRAVCVRSDPPEDATAFAFDATGRALPGWPVRLPAGYQGTGRMVGDDLVILSGVSVAVAPDGSTRKGGPGSVPDMCCDAAIGPDGAAYATDVISGWVEGSPEKSRITALDASGVRSGWPVDVTGIASGPAFLPDGRIAVLVGSTTGRTSRVDAFDPKGTAASATSGKIAFDTAEGGVDCVPSPRPPVVGDDGTVILLSEVESSIFALDGALEVKRGWPFRLPRPLADPGWNDPRYELNCGSLERPVLGPDGTLYLPIQARTERIGQSILAVGPDGRAHPGWPVELQRAGSEFWSIAVGGDGIVHALAVEPEAGGTYSATILAIAPDGSVLHRTTIIDP